MSVGELIASELSPVLRILRSRCPIGRTRNLVNSLRVRAYGEDSAVIGSLYPPYTKANRRIGRNLHPGIYGYILNQGRGKPGEHRRGRHVGWFTDITNARVPRILRNRKFRREAERLYLDSRGGI